VHHHVEQGAEDTGTLALEFCQDLPLGLKLRELLKRDNDRSILQVSAGDDVANAFERDRARRIQ
jgi:hypothetical protein